MANDLRSSAPGEYGATRLVAGSIAFGQSSVVLEALSAGDVVMQVWCEVVTAFNAATTNVLVVGDGTTGNKYLTSSDVTEGTPGVYPTGGKGPFAAEVAAGSLTVGYTQTGTAASTGLARVYALVTSAAL